MLRSYNYKTRSILNLRYILGERKRYREGNLIADNISLELIKGCYDPSIKCTKDCECYDNCMFMYEFRKVFRRV